MDLGPILEIFTRLRDCSANRIGYIRNLQNNLNSLQNARDELISVYQDVSMEIELVEEQQLKPTNEVSNWLVNVEAKVKEVGLILHKGEQVTQSKCIWSCSPKNCWSSYKLGKVVPDMIDELKALVEKRHTFHIVGQRMPHAPVEELPMETITVGLESSFDKVCKCFEDTSVGIIGLYGMGGVGKTTLLKKFNNDFLTTRRSHDKIDVVIWVVVSQELDIGKIQQVIRNKIHLPDEVWLDKNMEERAIAIFNVMKRKKFVLLLDDVWRRFDLLKLGIPNPRGQNGSRVLFTTRSEEVCGNMGAHRSIRVEFLAPERALELFQDKVGEETLNSHASIPYLAKEVVAECQGLPLALITVGRAMANKKDPNQWKRAIQTLKNYPSKVSGMVNEVFLLLEFSYNSLPSPTHKTCFLYCSLFPEDYNIKKDQLIELWIGEGFLDESGDVYGARIEGEDIIDYLKQACLLEKGEANEDSVKMHDVIRDMALWVACEHSSKPKFGVFDNTALSSIYASDLLAKWREAERLSLWRSTLPISLEEPFSLKLLTMIVQKTKLDKFPNGYFKSGQAIKVLDLSHNDTLKEIPAEIGELANLRYLNLSYTRVKELPIELNKLKSLRCLLINFTDRRLIIPRTLISSLSVLQVFSKLMPRPIFLLPASHCYEESVLLQELECLEHLKDISIALSSFSSLEMLLNSTKLQKCIKYLRLHPFSPDSHSSLNILNFTGHQYICNLHTLQVNGYAIRNLTWLTSAPNLRSLKIDSCYLMETIISEDFGAAGFEVSLQVFGSLETLKLKNLPRLRSIYPEALRFPSLKTLNVDNCGDLVKLPFDSDSAKSLEQIVGEPGWWDRLQWEDQSTMDIFSSKFQFQIQKNLSVSAHSSRP
ncbi:Disease resistance protein [Quillaja saponaria]|uniref:Disease resistance protein n=1 Tax=Quillaja saponaria TaxID=32244 RepID=A0AAD7LRL3_QUISA|nr:Disease resistance protein [Quillaja saponaria]